MNRSDALVAVFKAFSISPDANGSSPFQDVFWNDTVRPYAAKAVSLGIVGQNATFRPYETVSRAELTKMVVVASGLAIQTPTANVFADVPQSSGIAPYVLTLVKTLNIAQTGNFNPQTGLTRGTVANLMYAVKMKTGG